MADTRSRDTSPNRTSADTAPISVLTDPNGSIDARLSPHVEALRRLVAAGQYQVSPRYLAHKIMRAAGFKLD